MAITNKQTKNNNKQTKKIKNKTLEYFADFSKKEYFLAHGRPKLVCVQFKGSQAQITIRNGHNSCKCMIKMIIIYDDCTINDRRPNQVKRRSTKG